MSLKVKVDNCKELPNFEKIGQIDPYVVLTFRGIEKKTNVKDNAINPVWDNEEFEWTLQTPLNLSDVLKIEVYDEQIIGKNRLVGNVDYPVSQLWAQKSKTESLKLKPSKRAAGVKGAEKAIINLTMIHTSLSEQVAQNKKNGNATGVSDANVADAGETSSEGGLGYDVDEQGVHEDSDSTAKKPVRHPQLPDKPTDFQVRVHIIEGRKLKGNDVSPLVKVSCGNEFQKTSSRKGTNSPVFDETMIFNFKERPVELFEKKLEIKVMDTGKITRDTIIGIFSFDIGTIYYEPNHTFFHKWLLLTDNEDPSLEAKGFIKATLSVLGPKDDPIPSSYETSSDDVDIESNLLRPSGVCLQTATLSVKVYSAEDLPQMDTGYLEHFKSILYIGTGKKELVDPFAVVAFAGHKGSTDVKWNTQNPQWNEQINIGFQFPSICEKVKVHLKDKDKLNADDYIGTCIINIPDISAPGDDGFLPTFGPCYVNIYGSPREFSDLPDKYEHLNKGLSEGVAYRGRVLLELATTLGNLPRDKKDIISLAEQRKLQPFQHRQKYVLFAVFMSASMLQTGKEQVQFEVSIGNYGYSVDKNIVAQTSTTHPAYPIYDGCNYSYMPWHQRKPLIIIESSWEDCQYRMESLNLLTNIMDRLDKGITSIQRLLHLPSKHQDLHLVQEKLTVLLDELLENLRSYCPKLPDVYNKLDKQLCHYRMQEVTALCPIVDVLLANSSMDPQRKLDELEAVLERLKAICVEPQNSVPDVIIWMLVNGKRVAYQRIPSHLLMYSGESGTKGSLCGKVQTLQLNPPAVLEEKQLDGNKHSCLLRMLLWLGKEEHGSQWSFNVLEKEVMTVAEISKNFIRQTFQQFKASSLMFVEFSGVDVDVPEMDEIRDARNAWYENQTFNVTSWSNSYWSDSSGKIKLKKEYFELDEQWQIDSEDDNVKNEEEIVTVDVYEIQTRDQYTPWPLSESSIWADTLGIAFINFDKEGQEHPMAKEDINNEIPHGWQWITEWKIDTDGPVSSDGWEYSTIRYDNSEGFPSDAEFVPIEKKDHISRRRRWIRTRQVQPGAESSSKSLEDKVPLKDKGWQYARHSNSSLHTGKKMLDFFRRRKWYRSLRCVEVGHPAVFYISSQKDKKKKEGKARKLTKSDSEDIVDDSFTDLGYQYSPRTYLTFYRDEYTTYQLRAYLYQARDLYAADNTGLSDPYVVLSCINASQRCKTLTETLSPKWEETVILNNIRIYGSPQAVVASPPTVVLEFYDKDTIGQNEYIGMLMVSPVVRMTHDTQEPVLEWFPIFRYNKSAGEILAAFELIHTDPNGWKPPLPEMTDDNCYKIPDVILPETQKMRIEVLCWGVRDMKRFHLLPVNHPFVEVECGGEAKKTKPIVDPRKNPMFPNPILIFDTDLPVEDVYSPPINIRVFDQRKFGYIPLIGSCTLTSLKEFEDDVPQGMTALQAKQHRMSILEQPTEGGQIEITIDTDSLANILSDDEPYEDDYKFDWWSKYYASIEGEDDKVQEGYLEEHNDKLVEYSKELETFFDDFSDLAHTFSLHRGKGHKSNQDSDTTVVGYFKGAIKVYPVYPVQGKTPEAPTQLVKLPNIWPQEVVVRVYIVRGFDLQPKDVGGGSDPYIKVSVGKNELSDKENFIANQLNPIFGKVFDIDAVLPFDRTLTVTIMDHDYLSADDVIGSTTIDLENRFLSLHRPICGLPETFSKAGPNRWRDFMLPVDLLNNYCRFKGIPAPIWDGKDKVTVDGKDYTLSQFEEGTVLHRHVGDEQNRLALHILRTVNIVHEHVEKRTLYNSVQPGVPQGQLHMWVDIFPKLPGAIIPPKVDITPRKSEKYIFRVVIWNTSDVILDERSVGTRDSMSDIYVKGWLTGSDDIQKTDIHYRSMDGDGMFNWRFVFPFDYIKPEKKMVVKVKDHFFSLDKTERRLPVRFKLQVWDNDLLSPDDFLGSVEFDINDMPLPAKTKRRCRLNLLDKGGRHIDLFEQKHIKGWLPVFKENHPAERGREQRGNRTLTGKVEVEMEILTEEEERTHPAGKQRDNPNQNPFLEEPKRPELSFAWFASPFKTFKFIVWRHHKKKIIFGIIMVVILLSILMLL